MKGFLCNQTITYKGINPDLTVSFPQLIASIIEGSLLHTESTDKKMSWYVENNRGFLLTKWQVEVYNYPKWNDIITLKTWPINFTGILAERTFQVFDQNGEKIACANTGWVYIDLLKRRPIRVEENIVAGYGKQGEPSIKKDYDIPDYSKYNKINECQISVTRRDTDSNQHANNVAYLEWAADNIPDEIYENYKIVEMKTNYKKECVRGMSLDIETFQSNKSDLMFVVSIKDKENGNILALVYYKFG